MLLEDFQDSGIPYEKNSRYEHFDLNFFQLEKAMES